MLITAFRPLVTEKQHRSDVAPNTSPEGLADAFVSVANTRLSDVDAMAMLAQSAKLKPQGTLPEELAAAVTADLGATGITGFSDERVEKMNGYLRDGWETPFFDPIATLGQGWEQQEQDPHALGQPVVFSRLGDNVIQHLSLDQHNGTTTLHTIHSESFIRTRHYLMTQDRDGKVTISDETAH